MSARKFIFWLVLVLVAGNLALMAWVVMGRSKTKPQRLPNPNGYDDFVNAGGMLKGNLGDYDTMNRESLAALVSQNEGALKLLQTGLSHESRFPFTDATDFADNVMPALSSFKQELKLLCAVARLDVLNGRTNEAAQEYLVVARFAHECSRGGLLLHRAVGATCEGVALEALQPLDDYLDAKQCAEVARNLEQIDAADEPIAETLRNEDAFEREDTGLRERIDRLVNYKQYRELRAHFVKRWESEIEFRRRVMISFAARAYEIDHGKAPASVTDLVPAYLKSVPQDPATGTNMVYSPR